MESRPESWDCKLARSHRALSFYRVNYIYAHSKDPIHTHTHKHTLPILYMSSHVGKNIYYFLQFTQQTTNKSLQEFIFLVVYEKVNYLISSRYFLKYTLCSNIQMCSKNIICDHLTKIYESIIL